MGKRTTVASFVAVAAGPTLAGAEASGALANVEHSIVMYVIAGAATVLGLMFSLVVWFLKREHTAITEGIKSTSTNVHAVKNSVNAMALNLEELSGEIRADLAQRVKLSDFRESMNALHDKVNRQGKALSYVRAKIGLPIEED